MKWLYLVLASSTIIYIYIKNTYIDEDVIKDTQTDSDTDSDSETTL